MTINEINIVIGNGAIGYKFHVDEVQPFFLGIFVTIVGAVIGRIDTKQLCALVVTELFECSQLVIGICPR